MPKAIHRIKFSQLFQIFKRRADTNTLFFFSKASYAKLNIDQNASTNFLDERELKIVNNKKINFSSVLENRVNVFLKPLETDVTSEGEHTYESFCDVNDSTFVNVLENEMRQSNGGVSSISNSANNSTCSNGVRVYKTYSRRNKTDDMYDINRANLNNKNGQKEKNNLNFLSLERYTLLTKEKHMYIYDFEIYKISDLSKYEQGEIVNVYFYNKESLGIGLLNRKSNITIRIIERDVSKVIDDIFFIKKIYESVKRRFKYIYNINLYDYMYSFNIRNKLKIFCKIINSVNDELPGVVVYVFDKGLYIRYDNLAIQKYSYIFEKELDKIFSPSNIYCKKIISKKEKRAQKGKEYVLEQIKGCNTELTYCENNYTFYNDISGILYDIFDVETKQDRIFLQSLYSLSNILNINGNVGEYIINTSPRVNLDINSPDYSERISVILNDNAKNGNFINKNISTNNSFDITSLYREDILDELNNMFLNNLKFGLVIYNTKSNITYRKCSYTSAYGKRYVVSFKGMHKYLSFISNIMQKNGLLFVTVELSANDYHKFLNIVKCVFESKKKIVSIIYENSCSVENNILCIDKHAWYMRSICFRLSDY